MNPRRLQSDTMTSMFIGSPHIRLRLAPPCSYALPRSSHSPREPPLPGCGPETLDLAQEARGSHRLAGQASDVQVHDLSNLVLRPSKRHRHCLAPRHRPEPPEGVNAGGIDANRATRPGRAGDTGHATTLDVDRHRRARRGAATPTGNAGVDAEPMRSEE